MSAARKQDAGPSLVQRPGGGSADAERDAGRLDLRQGGPPYARTATIPVAAPADLEAALRAGAGAAAAWAARPPGERRALLLAAAEELPRTAAGLGLVRHLGLDEEEARPHLGGWRGEWEAELERLAAEAAGAEGIRLLLPRWTELLGELGRGLAGPLLAGRPVLVLSDDRLPLGAEAWAQALEAAGLEPGVLGLLHGAGIELRAAAVRAGAVGDARASATAPEAQALQEALSGAPGGPEEAPGGERLLVRSVGSGALELDPCADVAAAAARVARAAFGRSATLSGQLGGALGRVEVPDRLLSRFTEALLEALEGEPARDPVALADAEAVRETAALWELGLDEGATLIHGGEPLQEAGRRAGDRRVRPAVFTNVERAMQLATPRSPAPVLSLLRARGGPSTRVGTADRTTPIG